VVRETSTRATPFEICATSTATSAPVPIAVGRGAGALFSVSRKERKSSNDADRLRKYLARFGLDWNAIRDLT
jgi:transcriptional regulatory protein RtcR